MTALPQSWALTTLGDLRPEFQNGASTRGEAGGTPTVVLRLADVVNGRISLANARRLPVSAATRLKYLANRDDVLVIRVNGSSDLVGRFIPCETDALVFCDHFIRMKIDHRLAAPRFLALLGASALVRVQIERAFVSTAGQKTINQSHLRSISLPLPPRAEQERIVAAIEEQFSRLDAGVAALERVRGNLKRIWAAVLMHAFGQLGNATLASGDELFSLVTSGSRGWARYYSPKGAMFIRIGNVPRNGIDLDLTETQHVRPPATAEGRRTQVQPGDILISITADLGRVAVMPPTIGEAYVNQHIALARPTDAALPRYLGWYLASPLGLRQWDKLRRGATKIGLGLDDIRAVRIPVPSVEVQQSSVDYIETAWAGLQWLEESLTESKRRSDGLRSSILAAAFSGNLVPQDLADGPALMLLERVVAERASSGNQKPVKAPKRRRKATV